MHPNLTPPPGTAASFTICPVQRAIMRSACFSAKKQLKIEAISFGTYPIILERFEREILRRFSKIFVVLVLSFSAFI